MPHEVLIAFGANLGDGEKTFQDAFYRLKSEFGTVRAASLRRTAAVTLPEESAEAESAFESELEPEYWNSAFHFSVPDAWTPYSLLNWLLALEKSLGRERSPDPAMHWEARRADLDLLLWEGAIFDDAPTLVVPHPMMAWRRFVLEPAAELVPEWLHPVAGVTLAELLRRLDAPPNFLVEDSLEPVSPEIFEFARMNQIPILSRRWVCRCGEPEETFEKIIRLISGR